MQPMGTSRSTVVGLVFACFLAAVLLRPLAAIPGLAAIEDVSGVALWLPLVAVGLGVAWLRLRSDGDSQPAEAVQGNHWGETTREDGTADQTGDASAQLLGGQGGSRDRSFEIETEPPEAGLDDHLAHLRAELDGQTTELRTLEEVAEKVDDGQAVPDRCPECDALWEARTITGITAGRYERLDDGTVCCLTCEERFEP